MAELDAMEAGLTGDNGDIVIYRLIHAKASVTLRSITKVNRVGINPTYWISSNKPLN